MERDDVIEYSLEAHHSEEVGKKLRKKIWMVTAILTAITIAEVLMGAYIKQTSEHWYIIKWSFIVMTVFKAAFIVLSFMHLGDERKSTKWVILGPYIVFILYLLFICLTEAFNVMDNWAGIKP